MSETSEERTRRRVATLQAGFPVPDATPEERILARTTCAIHPQQRLVGSFATCPLCAGEAALPIDTRLPTRRGNKYNFAPRS